MTKYLPSVTTVVSTAITLVIVFAITDLLGGKNWILSPVTSWKNRNAS